MKLELSESELSAALSLVRHIFDSVSTSVGRENARPIREEWSIDDRAYSTWPAWSDDKTSPEITPPKVETPSNEEQAFGAERFQKGKAAFDAFVDAWVTGLSFNDAATPQDGVEQPDRGSLIRDLANGSNVVNVLAYVGKCGGLTNAIDQAITAPESAEKTRRSFVQAIAPVICATSSLLFPELSDHYEHRDIYLGRSL